MKQLVLGIDGGDLEVFNKFDMPFLQSLIKDNVSVELTEDLFSRGWVEMISGKHGRENKALYIMPKLDGTKNFSLSYSYEDLKGNSNEPLLWEVVEKLGHKAGIMNIPTTFPSPKLDGFFVSGAGGGLYKVNGIPDEMCSDSIVRDVLIKDEYILELRFKPSGITDIDELFESMNKMLTNRFKAFQNLLSVKETDFNFLALRATANLSYVTMFHVLNKNNGSRCKSNLVKHFSLLDNLIKKLFENFQPENFCLTSDHGLVAQKYHANYNIFLKSIGLYKSESSPLEILRYFAKKVRKVVKNSMGFYYVDPTLGQTDWSRTKVFGSWYSNALYVNDDKRFNGIVKQQDLDELVDKVCKEFNEYDEAIKYKMTAKPYRRNYKEAKFYDELPDIWIDAPDEIFFLGKGEKFITKSPWYKEIKSLKNIPSSMFTGTKGRNPICIMNKELASFISDKDEKDLTLIYHVTKRYFESLK